MNTTIHHVHQVNDHFAKFVPESARRLLTAGAEAPELAMRESDVSVLFLDISGYSHLSRQMSPRALNALVERYFSPFLDCIHAADGDINEIAGDGFMAIFQDESPREHVFRAVDTAFALLAATAVLNHRNHEPPLAVHMGLNSGLALVGLTRLEGLHSTRWTFTARGAMTNLAARLAALARPGQILVGAETVRWLNSCYAIDNLGYRRLKNLPEPIAVYCLHPSAEGPAFPCCHSPQCRKEGWTQTSLQTDETADEEHS